MMMPGMPGWSEFKKMVNEGKLTPAENDPKLSGIIPETTILAGKPKIDQRSEANELLINAEKQAKFFADINCISVDEQGFARQLLENISQKKEFGREKTNLSLNTQAKIQSELLKKLLRHEE